MKLRRLRSPPACGLCSCGLRRHGWLPSDPCWHTNNFYSTLPLTSIFGDPFPIPPPPQLLPLLTHPAAYSGQSPLNLQSDVLKSWTNAQSLWFPWPPHIDCSFELWGLRARLDQLHALLHLYDMHNLLVFFPIKSWEKHALRVILVQALRMFDFFSLDVRMCLISCIIKSIRCSWLETSILFCFSPDNLLMLVNGGY